jgi:hypothetical protein
MSSGSSVDVSGTTAAVATYGMLKPTARAGKLAMGRSPKGCSSMANVPVMTSDLRNLANMIDQRKRDELEAQISSNSEDSSLGSMRSAASIGGRRKTKNKRKHRRGNKSRR